MDIQLEKVTYQTLPIAYRIQKESFKQLFEHYQDTETSPYLETYENFSKKYQRENNYFYLIQADGSAVGFVRIVLSEAPALITECLIK